VGADDVMSISSAILGWAVLTSAQTPTVLEPQSPPALEPERNGRPPEEEPPPKPRRCTLRLVGMMAIAVLLAGIGYGIYRVFFYRPDANGLPLSGRIEGYETDVSARTGGRVATVAVREGDDVQPGRLLVQLDDSDLRAQLQGAQPRVLAAQQRLERARQQIPVL
jgi:HlyD family secretion protein